MTSFKKRMQSPRKFRFTSNSPIGGYKLLYDTAFDGPWTLTGYSLTTPERVTNFVTIPGRDGEIDLAAALTGVPQYKNRRLAINLENSDGTKKQRQALIDDMTNRLEGKYLRIWSPDDETHYLRGYPHVDVKYNDVNHCAVQITVVCDPWRESIHPVYMDLEANSSDRIVILKNNGGRRVIPIIAAYGSGGTVPDITISCGDFVAQPSADAITPEELAMDYLDEIILTYSGSGHLVIRWQEASL